MCRGVIQTARYETAKHTNILRLFVMKNFKGVFARVLFDIVNSDRLSFASVKIDENYSFTLSRWIS